MRKPAMTETEGIARWCRSLGLKGVSNALPIVLISTAIIFPLSRCAAQSFELTEASVADLSRAFDLGTLTSERLVQPYLHRIDAFESKGPELNSFISELSASVQEN
jgi:amidase